MLNRKGSDFIPELYQLCTLKMPEELRIASIIKWLDKNSQTIDNAKIKHTFKIAGREDLNEAMFIEVEDIDINDTIRSKQTGRVGKVIGVKKDNETIVVSWETGGQQLLSKGSVIKLNSSNDFNNYNKVQTETDEYKDLYEKDKN